MVKPVLLDGCETRKANEKNNKKLDSFHYHAVLKRIVGLFCPYIVFSIEELSERTNFERISIETKKRRWRRIRICVRDA